MYECSRKLDGKYFVHPEFYKKFVYAETLLKKRKSEDQNQFSKQLKTSKNEDQLAKNNLTYNADCRVKEAMEKIMLMDITGKDLIAREFQTHEKCYQDYTRILY